MPTKAELNATLKDTVNRLQAVNVEIDALQKQFEEYQRDADKMIVDNAADIRIEMINLARMESPVYALAYVEAALAAFPSYCEDDTIDLTRVPPNQQILREYSK